MTVVMRKLTKEDFHFYKQMENKLKNDYVLEMFNRLAEGPLLRKIFAIVNTTN